MGVLTGRSSEKGIADVGSGVGAFVAAPAKGQVGNRQSAGMNREADRQSVAQMVEVDVVAAQADLPLIDTEEGTDRELAQRVFEAPLKQ